MHAFVGKNNRIRGLIHTLLAVPILSFLHQFFAPSDAAWNKLPQARLDYLVSKAGVAELKQILSYHIVPGVFPSGSLITNSTTSTASILQASSNDLKITKSADGQVKINGIANVETPDVVSNSMLKMATLVRTNNNNNHRKPTQRNYTTCTHTTHLTITHIVRFFFYSVPVHKYFGSDGKQWHYPLH
jgi:Fasciclin domain